MQRHTDTRDSTPHLYITSKFARRGAADFNGRVGLPPFPTPAFPGTPEKVAVLEQRARMGVSLWHPLDGPVSAEFELLEVG